MANYQNIIDIKRRLMQGKGVFRPWVSLAGGAITAAAAGSGYFSNTLQCNNIGTTYPGTLVGFQGPELNSSVRCVSFECVSAAAETQVLGWFYRFGTVVLSATGDQFTHDSTFTRIQRTINGVTTDIPLLPLVYVTTAPATSAPVFTMSYADQDGNATVGTQTFTMPSATTAVQSCYNLMMDSGDSAVLDVTQVNLSVAGSVGAASIYGFEPIASMLLPVANGIGYADQIYGGPQMQYLNSATPDSGSFTNSFRGLLSLTNSGIVTSVVIGVKST